MADPITVAELPFPNEDPTAYAAIWIAGLPCPGQFLCASVSGQRERDTQHTKSKGSSRDILVDQGLKPDECEIQIRTTSGGLYRDLYDFYQKYMSPERPLSRLNVVTVAHPQLYFVGIKQAYFYHAGIPTPTRDGGDWPFVNKFKFRIVGPKTQISQSGGSSKPKAQTPLGGPTDAVFQTTQQRQAVAAIQALAAEDAANMKLSRSRPANQSAVIYTPSQVTKIANAGDPSARFIDSLTRNAAPRGGS